MYRDNSGNTLNLGNQGTVITDLSVNQTITALSRGSLSILPYPHKNEVKIKYVRPDTTSGLLDVSFNMIKSQRIFINEDLDVSGNSWLGGIDIVDYNQATGAKLGFGNTAIPNLGLPTGFYMGYTNHPGEANDGKNLHIWSPNTLVKSDKYGSKAQIILATQPNSGPSLPCIGFGRDFSGNSCFLDIGPTSDQSQGGLGWYSAFIVQEIFGDVSGQNIKPVSYTHLTLPTKA